MRTSILAGLLALALPACLTGTGDISGTGPGGGGDDGSGSGSDPGGGGPPPATPMVTATVDMPTVSTELGTTQILTYTLTSVNGFAGSVAVTPTVLDSTSTPVTDWTLTPAPASVTLAADGTATVALTVMIPTDNVALTPTLHLGLASTAAAVDVTSAFTVLNQVTIVIDAGTGTAAPHVGLPAANSQIKIHAGASIVFHNGDSIQHVIHGDGGIPHENTALGLAGTDYTVTPTDDGTWYCHDHESGNDARLVNVLTP